MKYILQCPRCDFVFDWERTPNGPGTCSCGAFAPWKVLKEKPKYEKGFVIVHSYLGKQELHAPSFKEDPSTWKK